MWFDSRLSRLHHRGPQGCCWCYERRFFSSFLAQGSQPPPQTLTHAHTLALITQQLFLPPRASSRPHTQLSLCAQLHGQVCRVSRGYGAASKHAKGWCLSLHSVISFRSMLTNLYSYSERDEVGGASERGGVGSERAMPGYDGGLDRAERHLEQAERVAPHLSSLLSSSCRQERDAARRCGVRYCFCFFFTYSYS